MKRFAMLSLLVALVVAVPMAAQEFPQEPENHTLVVERLMRYHDYGEYDREIQVVADSAREYLAAVVKSAPNGEKLAAVFDIDETSLSNWEAMAGCGFCAYSVERKLYSEDHDPAIAPVLGLYNFAKAKGVKVFFVTGRQESERAMTIKNLNEAGYSDWTELITQPDGNKLPAGVFKPKDRQQIVDEGYRIVLNIGDQASDLAGCCSERIFKIPNPFYLLK
jgi:predicted secreted acid phosphatase